VIFSSEAARNSIETSLSFFTCSLYYVNMPLFFSTTSYTLPTSTNCYSKTSGQRGYTCSTCSATLPPVIVVDDTPATIDDVAAADDVAVVVVTPAKSVLSCSELGWTNAATFGDSLVCGESDATSLGGSCSGLKTWANAKQFCEAGGSRLCTLDELMQDETRLTGCQYDRLFTWSSTVCVNALGGSGIAVTTGRTVNNAIVQCNSPTLDSFVVRCCADVFTTGVRKLLRRS
jgi:hypothetical protein